MNFIYMKSFTSIILSLLLFACGTSQVKEKKTQSNFKIESPNILTVYHPNTKLVKSKGPVKLRCSTSDCTEEEMNKFNSQKLEKLLNSRFGIWKEYVLRNNPGGEKANFIKKKGKYIGTQKEGFWEEYGQKKEGDRWLKPFVQKSGNYSSDKRNGKWKLFGEKGKVLRESNYQNGRKINEEKRFNVKGQITELKTYQTAYKENDTKDILNGLYWKKKPFKKRLVLSKEGQYKDNLKHGLWKEFDITGKLKREVEYSNDKLNGIERHYHKNGKVSIEGENQDNIRVGIWKINYPNGKLQTSGSYIARTIKKRDPKTKKIIKEEIKNLKTGEWSEFYSNGRLLAVGQRDHIRTGKWIFYDRNGKKKFEGTMSNEFMMSEVTIYDRNEKKLASGNLTVSLIKIDPEGKNDVELKKYKFSAPVTYYRNGIKEFEVTKNLIGIEYNMQNGKKRAEGEVIPSSNKKNGCWQFFNNSGKVTEKKYYINGRVNKKMGKMQNCI